MDENIRAFPMKNTVVGVRATSIGGIAEAAYKEAERLAQWYCPKAYEEASDEEKIRVLVWFSQWLLHLGIERLEYAHQKQLTTRLLKQSPP
jgi:hypothetical protein